MAENTTDQAGSQAVSIPVDCPPVNTNQTPSREQCVTDLIRYLAARHA